MGTTDLYAFLNVNTGEVFGKCTDNHKVKTLIQIFREHVSSFPDNSIIHYRFSYKDFGKAPYQNYQQAYISTLRTNFDMGT